MKRASWPERFGANLGFGALLGVLFLTFLDNTVASAVLTNVQSQLHAGVTELQWVVGSYALTFASLMLLSGSLADSFGRKKVMLVGVGIFCVGSVVAAIANSTNQLIVGRVIMGVGAAASEPGTLSMIRHLFPNDRHRARALGAWAAVSGLALAMGPVLGGILVGLWSWRAVFWFNLIFGLAALLVAALTLPESVNATRRRVDAGGFVVGALALGLATFATIFGESAGYRSASVVTLYVISGLLALLFSFIERHTLEPMLNPSFFGQRAFSGATFIAFTSYFSIFSIFFFVALYLEVVGSVSAFGLAVDFLPLLAGMVTASIFSGRWVGRVGSRTPLALGCLLAAVGVTLTNAAISPAVNLNELGWTMGLAGIGFGIIIVPINATALASLPPDYSGVAASTINTSRELGAVTGVAILGSIVNGQLTVQLTQRLIHIGIPPLYRNQIIAAVTNGAVNSQAKAFANQSSPAIQLIINKVVNAAYGAFGHGLDIALNLASLLLVISAVVAWTTGTREPELNLANSQELLSSP